MLYLVARNFAGVKNGRASSPLETFAEANRLAIKTTAEKACVTSVFAIEARNSLREEFIVSYAPGPSGKAIVLAVGEQS